CEVLRLLRGEEARLRLAVLREARVAVEVVGGEVQEAADARPQALHPLELEARDLGNGDLRCLVERADERRPQVAADEGPAPRARPPGARPPPAGARRAP